MFLFRLSFSKWTWIDVAFGETYEALVAGVQGAIWDLGGVTAILRSDNLSAATHELRKSGGRALTQRFKAVLDHYGMESTRIRASKSHENGIAEKAHDLIKSALVQHLQAAKRALELPRILRKLDRFEILILDDIGYTRQSAGHLMRGWVFSGGDCPPRSAYGGQRGALQSRLPRRDVHRTGLGDGRVGKRSRQRRCDRRVFHALPRQNHGTSGR